MRSRLIASGLVLAAGLFAAGFWLGKRAALEPKVAPGVERAKELPHTRPVTESDHPAVPVMIEHCLRLFEPDRATVFGGLTGIEQDWQEGSAGLLIECLRFLKVSVARNAVVELLERKTGEHLGGEENAWLHWLWNRPYQPHPAYAELKAVLYKRLDPRFSEYFAAELPATIRLDEIRWGGVRRDGIPPLKNPQLLTAPEANYLAATDIVFGVELNGVARAYPQRILAWHEMVKDEVGGIAINGVYCTLCGSMIVYKTELQGTHYELGTSGFLYRSNKLMYDHATKSLWSTLSGSPVVGTLVGQGLQLEPLSVVTTTWGDWRADHAETTVLSLETGSQRDYGEGVAYRRYFATDELMFEVPQRDNRLQNKDEVLAIRLQANPLRSPDQVDAPSDPEQEESLAISTAFLSTHRVYHDRMAGIDFVVVTDDSGANRVYESQQHRFTAVLPGHILLADDLSHWKITESALLAEAGTAQLRRLPAHRAFWFGWYSAFPKTRLVQ